MAALIPSRPTEVRRMSTEAPQEGLVHPDEIDDARAGEVGIPVHARCVSCRQIRFKRVGSEDTVEETDKRVGSEDTVEETDTFKHVCHECQKSTYYNVLYVLDEDPVEGSA
jgi:hypothetical protein